MCPAVKCLRIGRTWGPDQHDRRMAGRDELVQFQADQAADAVDVPRGQADQDSVVADRAAGPNPLLQSRIERDNVQPLSAVAISRAKRAREPLACVLGQQDRVLGPRCIVAKRFQNGAQLPDRYALAQEQLQDLLHVAQFQRLRDQLIDRGRRRLPQFVDQMLHGIAGQELVGMLANGFAQMRGDCAARVGQFRVDHALETRPCRPS